MVNIDGTDISGATIDGQDVQEITIDGQTAWKRIIESGLTSRLTFDGDFSDPYGNIVNSNDGVSFSTDSKQGTKSGVGDGSSIAHLKEFGHYLVKSTLSFSFWIKPKGPDLQNKEYVFTIESKTNYSVKINNGKLKFGRGDGSGFDWSNGTSDIVPDKWQHIVCTFDYNAGKEVEIWIDGNKKITDSISRYYGSTDGNYLFARKEGNTDDYYEGKIDDLRFYTRKLSPTEINKISNGNG